MDGEFDVLEGQHGVVERFHDPDHALVLEYALGLTIAIVLDN